MNWIFISIIVLTVGQFGLLGFSWPLLLSVIGRVLFLLRWGGTVIPYKVSVGFEAANLFFVFLGLVFTKTSPNWLSVIGAIVFCAIVALLYVIDNAFYLYVVVDITDEEDDPK